MITVFQYLIGAVFALILSFNGFSLDTWQFWVLLLLLALYGVLCGIDAVRGDY